MNLKLNIAIEAGTTTCTSNPGTMCRFFAKKHVGRDLHNIQFVCRLFQYPDGNDREIMKGTDNGWPQRLTECLAAENSETREEPLKHELREEPLVSGFKPANPRCTCSVPWICPHALNLNNTLTRGA